MKVTKKTYGALVDLDIVWIKNYKGYGLYQVYKIDRGKRIPLYKECFSSKQIQDIILNKNIITDEVFI